MFLQMIIGIMFIATALFFAVPATETHEYVSPTASLVVAQGAVQTDWSQYHQHAKNAAKVEFTRLYGDVDMIKVAARIEFDHLASR